MTLQSILWHVLGEQVDNMPVPLPGTWECQLSSFTGECRWVGLRVACDSVMGVWS